MYCTPPRKSQAAVASCSPQQASSSAWPARTSSRPHSQPAPALPRAPLSPSSPTKRSQSRASRPILPARQHSGSLVAQIALQNLSLHAWEVNPFEQSFSASSPPPATESPRRWAALVGAAESPPVAPAPPVAVNLFGYEAVGAGEGERTMWQSKGQGQQTGLLAPPQLASKWSASTCGGSDSDDELLSLGANASDGGDALDSITDYYFSRSYSKTDSDSSHASSLFGARRRSSPFGLEPAPKSASGSPAPGQDEWRPCGAPLRDVDNALVGARDAATRAQVLLLRKRTRSDTASAPVQPHRLMEWSRANPGL